MIKDVQYDFEVLQRKSNDLVIGLLGRGASEGDIQRAVKSETGQLMGRLGDAIGPKTKDSQNKKIEREVKKQLTIVPRFTNLDEDQQSSSKYADFTWLYASTNVLVGINDEDRQRQASTEEAYAMLRAGQKGRDRGDAYRTLGRRGKQKVMRLNRIQVSVTAYRGVIKMIQNKQGQLRAACYRIAVKYVPSKRVPGWIRSKFGTVEANGKSQVQETLFNDHGDITAIIRSPGVESNDRLVAKFQGAIQRSAYILGEKARKIVRGYKYNWETGQVFRQRDVGSDDGDN